MIANLTKNDWYFILTAVSKLMPFGPELQAQKAKVVAAVNAHYQELPTNG